MSLQNLLSAGLSPHSAQAISQRLQQSGALTLDDAVTLTGRQSLDRGQLLADARADWWMNPAIPMAYKRLLDAKAVNIPDIPVLGLTPVQAASQIVAAAKSAGRDVGELLPSLHRLWVEARDRYLDAQGKDDALPPDITDLSWAEVCALYVKFAPAPPDHPAKVLGVFLDAFED